MKEDSNQIFRLNKYYTEFIFFLNTICKGILIFVDEDTNKFYLRFCKNISGLLDDPELERLKNEDWKPFENIRISDLDIEWEYGGNQMCQRFLSLIEEYSINFTEPHDYLTEEDNEFLNSFTIYIKGYKSYKKIYEKNFKENSGIKMHKILSGSNVFIGHGQSLLWRELKDFIQDRLKLPWEEYNRISTAGISTLDRLKEMLNNSCFAFLVFTGEDESFDGKLRARENVIHEAGLFQGKLGFNKAIILLEEGCEEFSNIKGLGQIRFPKGKINTTFEEIRETLEREKIIEPLIDINKL